MTDFVNDWGLTTVTFLPLVGAVLLLLIPKSEESLIKTVALVATLATAGVGIAILSEFNYDDASALQFVVDKQWIPVINARYIMGLDGISLPLLALTLLVVPLCVIYSWNHFPEPKNPKAFLTLMLILQTGMIGSFVAQDLILFFVFFEVVLLPMYFMIGVWGGENRQYASIKFFLYTLFGSALMIIAFLALYFLTPEVRTAGGEMAHTFDMRELTNLGSTLARSTQIWIFAGMFIGFGIKVPMFPFHTWLPDAHTEAPTAGSVDLAGILLKLGTYGFLRYGLFLFPEAAVWAAPVMIALGTIGIVYGGIVAAMQKNMKRLVAYSSVAHMGFCVIGLFALNVEGIEGSILQMVNHGITTGALFILLGFLYRRRHTYEISELGGIAKVAPVFAGIFTVVMLASVGLPGLNGFVGEYLSLLGTYLAYPVAGIIATFGVILAALYLLWAYQRAFQGTPEGENAAFPDLKLSEKLVMVPLIGLIVFMGVYPKPFIDRIEPSVEVIVAQLERRVPGFESPGTEDGSDLDPVAIAEAEAASHAAGGDDHAEAVDGTEGTEEGE
ncbi:MAG: NADH-quinone oxidoreductase subunit M [Acidobacteriota bacterium]|nr:NADH-quinone oxidoreductase subunit M [Acidobacteriota bacterium]